MYERIRRIKEALGVADDTDYKKPTSGGRAEDHPPHLRTGQVYHGLLIPDANQADGGGILQFATMTLGGGLRKVSCLKKKLDTTAREGAKTFRFAHTLTLPVCPYVPHHLLLDPSVIKKPQRRRRSVAKSSKN